MAKLLIRTQDKPLTGNPYVDRHRSMRGCVIAIVPDSHEFSAEEKAAPYWKIVELPGVPPRRLTQLIAPDTGYGQEEAEKANRVLRRWAVQVDVDGLQALLDDPAKRKELREDPTKAEAHILAVKQDRPKLIDPAVIGPTEPIKVFR